MGLLATFTLVCPLYSWNATGHRVIAFAAWQRLKPQARERVIALLERHPDFSTILSQGVPANADRVTRARAAFLTAAVWPDLIRGDRRFYDRSRNEPETPTLPGFPDMEKRATWHYKSLPFSPDGTPLIEQPEPHAESEAVRIIGLIGKPLDDPSNPAYLLPWLLHIVGDIHQPLHCTSRFVQSQPQGDRGGNEVWVEGPKRLHAYWDDLPGTEERVERIETLANALPRPWPVRLSDPAKWLQEGLEIAKSDVYTFGFGTGSREQPILLPSGYRDRAQAVARKRMAIAGIRLARILNQELGR